MTRDELIERKRCAKIADKFEADNFHMATDAILFDPVLSKHRKGLSHLITEDDYKVSEAEMGKGVIHSSMKRAAQNIRRSIIIPTAPMLTHQDLLTLTIKSGTREGCWYEHIIFN